MRFSDLKTYLKFLSRNKLYTFVTVVGFSVSLMFVIVLGVYVKGELSVDNFHEKGDRIFAMANEESTSFGPPVGDYVQNLCPEVESYCRVLSRSRSVAKKPGSEDVFADVLYADSTFFGTFSFPLLEGKPDEVLKSRKSVVVTRSFVDREFPETNPIGTSLNINGEDFLVTGIAADFPQNTLFPQVDLIADYSTGNSYWLTRWNNFGFSIFFLEKEGADLSAKAPLLLEKFKNDGDVWYYKEGYADQVQFISLRDLHFRPDIKVTQFDARQSNPTTIKVYLAIALLILVISMLNYINMTVAQAGFRGKEAALRKLLGSSRGALVGKLLGESLLMTLFAFLLGGFLAFLAEPFFNDVLSTQLDLAHQFTWPVTLFVLGMVLLIALVSGLVPAMVISRFQPIEIVKGTFQRKVKGSYSRVLSVFQYAVSVALLACSLLIIRQSDFMSNYDMGIHTDRVLFLPNVITGSSKSLAVRDELRQIPGVEEVSRSRGTPLGEWNNQSFSIEGAGNYSFTEYTVDSAFFRIFGIEITPTDAPVEDGKPFWISRHGYNTLQSELKDNSLQLYSQRMVINGIFEDFHFNSLREEIGDLWIRYLPDDATPWNYLVKISPEADLRQTTDRVVKAYTDFTDGQLFEYNFLDDNLQKWYEKDRKMSRIMTAFSGLTLLILLMGVFAMALYTVQQKRKEIGVRRVNGATVGEILLMLNRQVLWSLAIAFLVACPVAYYAIDKWLENFAYRIPLSWWVFVMAGVAVLALAVLSVTWQSWRTARTNPVESLRSE